MFERWAGKTIESIFCDHMSSALPWFIHLFLFFLFFGLYKEIITQIRLHRKSKQKGGELCEKKAEEASQ